MKLIQLRTSLFSGIAVALLAAAPAHSQESPWAGQTFLPDYSKLQPAPGTEGKDYIYINPKVDAIASKYTKVMLDQPEVFIGADSPYKGAKPEDIAAIAGAIRSTAVAAFQERGYAVVDAPGPDTLYIRVGVTDLSIKKKKRGLLSYTPVGIVVSAGANALKDFMDKYDILDMSLQAESQDSVSGEQIGALVLKRGKSADTTKPISFDALMAASNEYSERLACRLDNTHVPADQRIDCTDPATRKARPKLVGQ
jgi:hypothetical protein